MAVWSAAFALLMFVAAPEPVAPSAENRFTCLPGDNGALCALYKADQLPRAANPPSGLPTPDLDAVARVKAAIAAGTINSANDYFRAATILIHSPNSADYLLAHVVATEGLAKYPGHLRIRLLLALALDRYLLAVGQPQVFGTQLEGNATDRKFRAPLDCELLSRRQWSFFVGDYPDACPGRR